MITYNASKSSSFHDSRESVPVILFGKGHEELVAGRVIVPLRRAFHARSGRRRLLDQSQIVVAVAVIVIVVVLGRPRRLAPYPSGATRRRRRWEKGIQLGGIGHSEEGPPKLKECVTSSRLLKARVKLSDLNLSPLIFAAHNKRILALNEGEGPER